MTFGLWRKAAFLRAKFEAERLVGLSAEVCLATRPVMDGFNLEMMRRIRQPTLDCGAW